MLRFSDCQIAICCQFFKAVSYSNCFGVGIQVRPRSWRRGSIWSVAWWWFSFNISRSYFSFQKRDSLPQRVPGSPFPFPWGNLCPSIDSAAEFFCDQQSVATNENSFEVVLERLFTNSAVEKLWFRNVVPRLTKWALFWSDQISVHRVWAFLTSKLKDLVWSLFLPCAAAFDWGFLSKNKFERFGTWIDMRKLPLTWLLCGFWTKSIFSSTEKAGK